MKDGFYPALGTPTGEYDKLVKSSYEREIDLMIRSGAVGMLCMGSMGKMSTVRNSEYPEIAKYCVEFASGRVPVMTGVMDCSVSRISDRIEALGTIDIDGVVATVPFYSKINAGQTLEFFSLLARISRYPVFVYDLPSVTQTAITKETLLNLMEIPNIKGIKTANLNLILELYRGNMVGDQFLIFYSGLDLFDVAVNSGIKKNLDGMFTCTPENSKKMYEDICNGRFEQISACLDNILKLRNIFAKGNILPAYSYAMELLGCPGNYHPDYDTPVSNLLKEEIYQCMKEIKEI